MTTQRVAFVLSGQTRSFTDVVTRDSIRQNAIDALCPSPAECAAVLFLCAELGECRAVAAAPPASASEFRAAAANFTSGLSSWIDATDHECASFSATLHCGADETAWCSGERRRCAAPATAAEVPLPTWALGMLRQRECLGAVARYEAANHADFGWVAFLRFDAGFFAPLPPLSAFAVQ